MIDVFRGEVWDANLDPVRGREQRVSRPVLVISDNRFNNSEADLVIVIPFTRRKTGIPYRVPVEPPEGGLDTRSYAICEQIRSVSKSRLYERRGVISSETISSVEDSIKILLDL